MTLGSALSSPRSGNLDALRLFLAAMVIVSHAWPLALGPQAAEPMVAMSGRSLGGWAVGVFFFVSGMLITASAERKNAGAFWQARFRRIVPGLGVALLFTLLVASVSGSSADVLKRAAWFLRALTLVSIEHRLEDAFAANPYPLVVNGPLWSLFHEVAAYGVCWVFVALCGARSLKRVAALVTVAALLVFADDVLPGRLATFAPLFLSFALGMAVHVCRHRIELTMASAVVCVALAAVLPSTLALGLVGCALVLTSLRLPVLRLHGDVSYGLYIYSWPVAQSVVALVPGIGPVALAALTLVATYPFALASWRIVERPAMTSRPAVV
jgi:peptidoglycan/LPS O-acetylase OafA/YrhL